MKAITKYVVLMLTLAGAAFAAGCNTIEGAGEDIQAGGAAISDAAENAKS